MEVIYLKNDGRCRWLEKKVLKGIFPRMAEDFKDHTKKKKYLIIDWVSNDNGKVGLDLNWLASIGVPTVPTYHDLPKGNNFAVVNTGYDSIVEEEILLRSRGVEIIDLPCPYVRKLRIFIESTNPELQCILLCEANHIIIKNFKSIFPEHLIIVQMTNYRKLISEQEIGKPFRLIPYVTFLPDHIREISNFLAEEYPDRKNETMETNCMWIKSPVSPIIEIQRLPDSQIKKMKTAALISSPGSINKSLISLIETISKKGLHVEIISSLDEFKLFENNHANETILLVRSPIPNEAEGYIMKYLKIA